MNGRPTDDQERARRLRADLEGYVAHDAVEESFRARMLDLVAMPERAFRVDSFVPGHFTGSVYLLDEERAHLLLLMHRKLGRWLQPGGHVDPVDPDVAATARRETEEETGIALTPEARPIFDLDIHPIAARSGQPAHFHFDVRYLAIVPRAGIRLSHESTAASWRPLGELEATADEDLRRVLAKIRALPER